MSDHRLTWNDRPVTFVEFSMKEGDTVMDAFASSRHDGSRLLMVYSLRYADTNEPVFASLAEIEALPFRHFQRLSYLSARCAFANGFGSDPDAPPSPPAPDAKANGHAQPPGPSL